MMSAGKKILVVDDEQSVLMTYDVILQRQGYIVGTALSYDEAIRQLESGRFDLVFTDFSLDRQHTGFEVIEHARRMQPDIQALMFTGYASRETAERARAAGLAIFYKPIDLPDLFTCLKGMLGEATNENNATAEEKDSRKGKEGSDGKSSLAGQAG